jgi:hypothetical protein
MTSNTGTLTRAMVLILVVGVLSAAIPAPSVADEVKRQPVNVSLFFPISTNQDPTILTNFRLNLMYGRVGYIKGFDIGTIVSRTDRDMHGVQLTGVYSQTGGDMRVATITGGMNFVGGSARGVQIAGLINFNRSWFRGIQYATLFNFVQDKFVGFQWASVFNMSNADFSGVQLSSSANLTGGNFRGFQIAGLNYVNNFLRGAQIGALNFAVEYSGAQIGVINVAGKADGVIIGAINYVRELDGVPVGGINWDKTNGNADWSIYASNVVLASTGLRTLVHGYTSTVAAGIGDIPEDRNDTAFLSWYYGYLFPLGEKWHISPDLGYVHVMPQSQKAGKINDLHFMLQARVTGEVRVAKIATIFFGGGVSVRFSEYSTQATTEVDPLIVGGVALY